MTSDLARLRQILEQVWVITPESASSTQVEWLRRTVKELATELGDIHGRSNQDGTGHCQGCPYCMGTPDDNKGLDND